MLIYKLNNEEVTKGEFYNNLLALHNKTIAYIGCFGISSTDEETTKRLFNRLVREAYKKGRSTTLVYCNANKSFKIIYEKGVRKWQHQYIKASL